MSLDFEIPTVWMPPPVPLRAFTLALIQLGNIGSNKAENLRHAREMILRAASGQGKSKRPDLIVLPVRLSFPLCYVSRCHIYFT
jgi:omega-amidase